MLEKCLENLKSSSFKTQNVSKDVLISQRCFFFYFFFFLLQILAWIFKLLQFLQINPSNIGNWTKNGGGTLSEACFYILLIFLITIYSWNQNNYFCQRSFIIQIHCKAFILHHTKKWPSHSCNLLSTTFFLPCKTYVLYLTKSIWNIPFKPIVPAENHRRQS